MGIPPTDQCSRSGWSPSTHFPNAQVDTWHALAIEMKAEVMYLPSAGKRLISTGKPCFWRTLLGYVLQFFFFFGQIESLWQPYMEQVCRASLRPPLSQQHLLALSQCHVLVILAILQTFSFLSSSLWWSVISDLWCYYYNCFGEPQTTPW